MNSGVYVIRNVVNDHRYVGSTGKLSDRWYQHKSDLKRQVHRNGYLQRAWNKYGEQSFVYEIIEKCLPNGLLDREEYWINCFHSHKSENGYNLCRIPRASRLGCKASPETLAKMRQSLGGKNHPMWGRHLTKFTRDKLSRIQSGISKPTSGARKKYRVIDPQGSVVEFTGLRQFCRDKGLIHSMFWRMVVGKQPEYMGWTTAK